jgi:DNA-binding MarR family transcriptional regulator
VDVLITEKGLELLRQLERQVEEGNRNIVNLTQEEAIQLNDLLDKLRG